MRATVTISLPRKTFDALGRVTRARGASRSALIREAVEVYLWQLRDDELRRKLRPLALRKGLYTEDDVYRFVS